MQHYDYIIYLFFGINVYIFGDLVVLTLVGEIWCYTNGRCYDYLYHLIPT